MAGLDGGVNHRDVLAIVSLLGPIVLLAGSAPVLDRLVGWLRVGTPLSWQHAADIPDAPVWAIWSVVALLSLFRMRRTAAVGAWLGTFAFVPAASLGYRVFLGSTASMALAAGWTVLGAVVAAALTWSPGPARGWELVGGRRIVLLVAAVGTSVALVMLSLGTYGVLFFPMKQVTVPHTGRLALWFLALAVLVAGTFVAGGVRTRVG